MKGPACSLVNKLREHYCFQQLNVLSIDNAVLCQAEIAGRVGVASAMSVTNQRIASFWSSESGVKAAWSREHEVNEARILMLRS